MMKMRKQRPSNAGDVAAMESGTNDAIATTTAAEIGRYCADQRMND